MRKNVLMGMFAAAAMLFATSCQKEELGTEVPVSFSLTQPGIATKAYSDGEMTKKLAYAVYEASEDGTGKYVTSETGVAVSNKQATVNLRLVTGQTYDIIFWADAENSPYTFDAATKTVTVNYDGNSDAQLEPAKSQDESRDAFFAVVKGLEVTGAISKPVTLYRPFAQLNIGTTDAEEPSVQATYTAVNSAKMQSSVTVSNIYSTFNLLTGVLSGERSVTFNMAPIPGGETFPILDVTYLSMNYLLVATAQDQPLVNIEFSVAASDGTSNKITRTYTNVPVKRNYRTNIYGKLLTDPAAFNITIDPDYEKPDFDLDMWDGQTITEPQTDADGSYLISNAAELAWIAAQFNGRTDVYGDIQSIKLINDIDLNSMLWTPINAWDPENSSAITLDGQGYTIKNLRVESGSNAGFIGSNSRNWTISNLTFENPVVESTGSFVGTVIGYQYGNVTMDNVTVTGADIKTTAEKGIRVGGLVGFSVLNDGAQLTLTDCMVENSTVTGYHNVAGLVGTLQDYDANTTKWSLSGNNVTGCTFNVTITTPSNVKYGSPFAVEGANYPHTYYESITYFSGNTESYNTFNYWIKPGLDLGLRTEDGEPIYFASTIYGVSAENPLGEIKANKNEFKALEIEEGWHWATYSEWCALQNSCEWTLATVNGVVGYNVTGNGETLFLPLYLEEDTDGEVRYFFCDGSQVYIECDDEFYLDIENLEGDNCYSVWRGNDPDPLPCSGLLVKD